MLEKLLQRINNRSSPSNDDDEDEDDKIKMQDSDENEDQVERIDVATLEVLQNVIVKIKETLIANQSNALIPSVYDQETKVPLGVERLGAI